MILSILLLPLFLATLSSACFCGFSSPCGCGGGSSYGGSYGGSASYAAPNTGAGSYAVFYRDLTPFRQPYYPVQQQYPQYYPQAIAPAQVLPRMYPLPNPRYIRPQQPMLIPRPAPRIVAPPPPPPPQQIIDAPPVYSQPPAQVTSVAQVVPETPRVTLHDAEYRGQDVEEVEDVVEPETLEVVTTPVVTVPIVVTTPEPVPIVIVTTPAPAPIVYTTPEPAPIVITTPEPAPIVVTTPEPEVPDFIDDESPQTSTNEKEEKDEFYYVYYDEKGNKVGDSKSGSTFAPQDVIVETTEPSVRTNKDVTYDDVVEQEHHNIPEKRIVQKEPTVKSTAVLETEDAAYEDETVSSEMRPIESKTNPEFKRDLEGNQILVDASEAENIVPYRLRSATRGVKIAEGLRAARKMHSN